MISNDILNTLVIAVLLAIIVGAGVFVTQKQQPETLERLEQEEMTLRLRRAEITELLTEQSGSRELAEDAVRRWNARYKVLPQHLTSPAVVSYLNQLSASGFKSFDISLGGVSRGAGFSTLAYSIRGVGHFESLYRFIWEVENGRGLYRVNDLHVREVTHDEPNPVTDIPRRQQLVEFSMTLLAYFGGGEGMSAPDSVVTVPDWVLPAKVAADNPFFPLVMATLPPNTDNLVDVEMDELISVVGQTAVFRTSAGPRPVREGERIYLGRITEVDAQRARLVAELNKGGIRERLEVELASGERFRQALGRMQLIPLHSPPPARPAPPQPGTPEYLRLYPDPLPGVEVDVAPARTVPAPEPTDAATASPERGVAVRPFPGSAPAETPQD
jgi:Tfp pilus assembly protein PilO